MDDDEIFHLVDGPGINSYSRMGAALEAISRLSRLDRFRVLGVAWPSCDNIAAHVDVLRPMLATATREELDAMMAAEDMARLARLPETFTVWRGCYSSNMEGLSWSLNKDTARGFPSLLRYRQQGEALLVEGRATKDRAVLITERQEDEIIASDVEIVSVSPI